MAAFGKQLSDADIAAVVTYQRNAWDNKVGDMVQPVQVAAVKGGAIVATWVGNGQIKVREANNMAHNATYAHSEHGHPAVSSAG